MAAIKFIKRTVALDGNSISEQLPASFFNGENTAHTFIIAAMRGGESIALSGAVSATFLNANDAVVTITGSIVDGAAVVTLSNDCYALSGRFTLTIDVNGATVYECQSRIKRRSSSTAYDPTGEISVATLSALIAEMRTATATANAAAATANAAANSAAGYVDAVAEYNVFNIPTTNKDGSTRNGVVTTVTGPYSIHAEGTATANWFHNMWIIPALPDYLEAGDTIYLLCESTQSKVSMQLLTTTDGSNWTIVQRIYGYTEYTIPSGVVGISYRAFAASGVSVNADIKAGILTNKPVAQDTILAFNGLENHTDLNDVTETGITTMYDAITYANAPADVGTGYLWTINSTSSIFQLLYAFSGNKVYKRSRNVRGVWRDWALLDTDDGTFLRYEGVMASTDFNDETETGIKTVSSGTTYANAPFVGAGFLWTVNCGTSILQLMYDFSGNQLYKRRRNIKSVWSSWARIGGGDVTNQYTFNQYTNTYNVTATPTITTDTNNYLASTGDTTDRTSDIVSMLTQTGICNLGPGLFVVSNLSMPKNTALRGSGPKTELRLAGTADGYAVKMNDYCQVSDLTISGASADITLPETVGERHGILWQGNYTANHNGELQPKQGLVSDVAIRRFIGGGITCYDTGYSTYNNLCVVNAQIRNCGAGLNIAYWSEFHKFTNCRCFGCLYGCINNGGNNMFVNCDFSSCSNGFLMDNSQGQSPNNAHGACIGCIFHHTANNTGVGIKILNCDNGYIFDGCQIGFSRTIIEDSVGIVFANMFFGQATNCDITITGGGAITFANNMHIAKPPITVTNNSNVRFINCYVASTGAAVSA